MLIGNYLKFERKKQMLTIRDLAKKTNLSATYISQIENGERNSYKAIKTIMDALGLTLEDCKSAGVSWWDEPEQKSKPSVDASVMISASPGTGKSEYLKIVLEYFEKIRSL